MKRNVYIHQFQTASLKNFLPLSAALLTSYAKNIPEIYNGYNFEIDILRRDPSNIVQSYDNPYVTAFSTYSWNFRQSLEVARLTKISFPDNLIVFGGPMIPNDSDRLYNFFKNYSFVDILVHGMGEWPFSEILLYRLGIKSLNSILGISYISSDNSIITQEPLYDRDINEVPSPFLNGIFDDILTRYGDRITGALWETNRGCPYRCTYCVQGNSSFSKIVKFDIDRLQKELEWISNKKISYVFGTDANFGILPRDVEIAKMMADIASENNYPKFFIINWLKNSNKRIIEIIDILKRGGINTRLTLSVQSFNSGTLAAINRRNIRSFVFEDIIKECSRKKIPTYTEIILGLPNDTYESILHTIEKCMDRHYNHYFIVYLCRLLDSTEMSKPEYINRYQICTSPCRVGIARHEYTNEGVIEIEDIVVSTSSLPVQDWKRIFTFVSVSLVLYNFRLVFFIFNYLRKEYSIDLIDLINYSINQSKKYTTIYPTIYKAVNIINKIRESILNGGTYLTSLDFIEDMVFEAHEAALLILIREKEDFYKELWKLINEYLCLKDIISDPSILEEVFLYQYSRIPTWKNKDNNRIIFRFNIPQYFKALCEDDIPISIDKMKSIMKIQNNKECNNPYDLIKSRLTISTFDVNDIKIEY